MAFVSNAAVRSLGALAAALVLAATSAAPVGAVHPRATNFRLDVDTAFSLSQGQCCVEWYFGTPTQVTAPRIGLATLTTFFSQCFSTAVCIPQNSQLTVTFEAKNGDQLVLLGYAPNLGTVSLVDSATRIDVGGTWTVLPSSTGRFAGFRASGTFAFSVVQPMGSVGGTEHLTLTGTVTSAPAHAASAPSGLHQAR